MEDSNNTTGSSLSTISNRDEYARSSTHSRVNNLSTKMNNPIYRREKVLELKIKEYSQTEIAEELGISQPTVSRYLQAIEERHLTLGERYPDRMSSDNEKMNLGYDLLLKVQWNIVSDPSASTSEKLRACSQIANCYTRKQHMNSNRHNIRLLAQELKNEE